MSSSEESRHDMAFMAGAVIGAVAGALTTLALTPVSGAEAREKMRARTSDLGTIRERVATVASSARERAEPVKERATAVASTAREKVEPVRERALELAAKAPVPIGRSQAENGDLPLEAPSEPVIETGETATE